MNTWVGDITYTPTDGEWLYLAEINDFYSRKIIGGRLIARMTKDLVITAMKQAVEKQNPQKELIFHLEQVG